MCTYFCGKYPHQSDVNWLTKIKKTHTVSNNSVWIIQEATSSAILHRPHSLRAPQLSSCCYRPTHLVGDGCSVSELWDRAGGLELRFTHAFSFGGGAGITFRGWSGLGGLEVGEWQSSSLLRVSFSRDFSLSLLRVSVGERDSLYSAHLHCSSRGTGEGGLASPCSFPSVNTGSW